MPLPVRRRRRSTGGDAEETVERSDSVLLPGITLLELPLLRPALSCHRGFRLSLPEGFTSPSPANSGLRPSPRRRGQPSSGLAEGSEDHIPRCTQNPTHFPPFNKIHCHAIDACLDLASLDETKRKSCRLVQLIVILICGYL